MMKKSKLLSIFFFIFLLFVMVGCGETNEKCKEHSFEKIGTINPATCHSNGIDEFKCKNCGVTKTEATQKLEHKYGEYHFKEYYYKPTLDNEGTLIKTCEYCGGDGDVKTLPSFLDENGNVRDCYELVKENESDQLSCQNDINVKFQYKEDIPGATKELLTFSAQYKGEHKYVTTSYLFSEVNHYLICNQCGEYDVTSKEAHNLTDGKCSCGYVDSDFEYALESGEIAVIYTGSAENIVIPALYEGDLAESELEEVKQIKSIINVDNGIKSITIPSTIESIKLGYQSKLYSLEDVYYSGTWADWCSMNFNAKENNPMVFASNFYMLDNEYKWEKVSNIVLPEGITKIGQNVFEGFKAESLTLPTTVSILGDHTFGCDYVWEEDNENMWWPISTGKSFDNIYYQGTLEQYLSISSWSEQHEISPYLGTNNFFIKDSNNQYVEVFELIIPESITEIRQHFAYNEELTSITILGNTTIGIEAFDSCTSLSTINIGVACVQFNNDAFKNCDIDIVNYSGTISDWCNINFGYDFANPLFNETDSVEFNVEGGKYQKNSYVVPDSVVSGSYTELHSSFLVIPSTVNEIKQFAFYGFKDNYLLQGRDNGYFVVIEDGVTSIGLNAFAGCTISSIFIPKSVTTISDGAFANTFNDATTHVIYYEGTKAEWEALSGSLDIGNAEVYYYDESAGYDSNNNYWYYDENGYVYEVYQGVASVNKVASLKYDEQLEN